LEDSARASLLISCLIQAVRSGKYEVNCSCHRKEEQFLDETVFYLTCTPTFDPPHAITGPRTSAAYSAVRLSYRYGGVLKKELPPRQSLQPRGISKLQFRTTATAVFGPFVRRFCVCAPLCLCRLCDPSEHRFRRVLIVTLGSPCLKHTSPFWDTSHYS
jgi:hypothetical protein